MEECLRMWSIHSKIMFKRRMQKKAIERHVEVKKEYESLASRVKENSDVLKREGKFALAMVNYVEKYVTEVANQSQDWTSPWDGLSMDDTTVDATVDTQLNQDLNNGFNQEPNQAVKHLSGFSIGGPLATASLTSGLGLSVYGPKAVMALATTCGTTSSGAQISSLNGSAQKVAALAWLGGGSRSTGGGGVAAGKSLLALVKPVGWTITFIALVGSAIFFTKKNKLAAEKIEKETSELEKEIDALRTMNKEIIEHIKRTAKKTEYVSSIYEDVKNTTPLDYEKFTPEQRMRFNILIDKTMKLKEYLLSS